MSTPTKKILRDLENNVNSRIDELQSAVSALADENEDLKARVEELEEREGIRDDEDGVSRTGRAVEDGLRDALNRTGESHEYDDYTPSVVGERERPVSERDNDEILAELGIREREFVAASGGIEIFRDRNGDYRLTTEAIRDGLSAEIQIANPSQLRQLADLIEVEGE